jgi:hypothetical protein
MKIDNYNLADFICIGAPKSGTTALYEYLKYINDIALHEKLKEPNYLFIRQLDEYNKKQMDFSSSISGFDEYVEFYNQNTDKITGDISPNYLQFSQMTLQSIKELYKDKINDLKILVILREPIDRMVSHYNMFLREEIEDKSFEEAIFNNEVREIMKENIFEIYKNRWPVNNFDYFNASRYYKNLEPYYEIIGKENIKVVLFDDFIKNTYNVLDEILDFLDVKTKFDRNVVLEKVGQGGKVKKGYKTLYRFFTKKNVLKDIIKPFIPFSLRKKIKSNILENKKIYQKYKIPDTLRKELYIQYFKEDIEKLEKLIDKDLSHWKY